jgi:phenolic acid decarboxylase
MKHLQTPKYWIIGRIEYYLRLLPAATFFFLSETRCWPARGIHKRSPFLNVHTLILGRTVMSNHEQRADQLNAIVGKRLVYVYENGWKYELYVKNGTTIDYRIHSGIVGGRWVKDQEVYLVYLGKNIFKISWTEPTGTDVSLAINLEEGRTHGIIFFPRWVADDPQKTVCFQNDHIQLMQQHRDSGPTYPKMLVDEFSEIRLIEDVGSDDDAVIACAPQDLPKDDPLLLAIS